MNRCIYSHEYFADADAEHIMQNFLGARWSSSTIVSNKVQGEFGKTIDVALEKGLQPIRNLMGTLGGRGGVGPILKRLTTTTGEVIDLEPGGKPRIAAPQVKVRKLENGKHDVRISLGAISQLGWALAILREKFPDLKVDVNHARALAQSVSGFVSGQTQLNIGIGGKDYFRGVLKSCLNLVGACNPALALEPRFDAVREFILQGNGEMSDFVRWSTRLEPLPLQAMGQADHFIGIASVRGAVEGIVQLFGEILHPVRLASSYEGTPLLYSYCVNPFRDTTPAEQRNSPFDMAAIPPFLDQQEAPGPQVWKPFETRLRRLVQLFYERADQELVDLAIEEVLKPAEGQAFTAELAAKFSQRLAELFAHRMYGEQGAE